MIRFDLQSMAQVKKQIVEGQSALQTLIQISSVNGTFVTAPSLQSSFSQHLSFFGGQPGAISHVVDGLRRDIEWLQEMFESHISAFSLQDKLSAGSFDQMNSYVEFDRSMFKIRQPNRDFKPINNLMYTHPVSVVEAATPLAALIAMFEGNDSAPIQAAQDWSAAGQRLVASMTALQSASSGLAASAEGYSFDMARSAIDDVVKTGNIVGSNAVLMGQSMMEFPGVRIANLNALYAIQASTAAIPDQAARIAAEQSAVATFASTQLQPSLELLRPPVQNLGIPVIGHTGGGVLDEATTSQSSGIAQIHTPQGGALEVSPANAQGLGERAQSAATGAPQPNPTVSPASANTTAPQLAPQNATNVASQNLAISTGGPTGAVSTTRNSTAVNPSGMRGGAGAASHNATRSGNVAGTESVRGGVGQINNGSPTTSLTGGNGPVLSKMPQRLTGSDVGAHAGSGTNQSRGAMGGQSQIGKNGVGAINGGMNSLNNDGAGNAGSTNSTATGNAAGKSGQGMAGGLNGKNTVMGMGPGAGQNGKKMRIGAVNSRNAKTAAGIFGKGKWSPGVNEYFKRQFLGTKKRTVKEVIR